MVGILLHVELLEKSNFELIDTTFAIVHFKQIDLLAVNNPMQRFFVFFFINGRLFKNFDLFSFGLGKNQKSYLVLFYFFSI